MTKIEQLKSDIEKIEAGLKSSTTDDRFKEGLRKILSDKKAELESIKSEPKQPEKKAEKPVAKPVQKKEAKSPNKILDDCKEILKKYNKEKQTASKRVADRRKQGKPATLTPSETVSKTAKSVKAKVVDMKEKTDKGLPSSEVNKLSSGIIATVKSTLSGITSTVEKHKFLNHLVSEIRALNTHLPKVAMDGGMFEDGGITNIGGTEFSTEDLSGMFAKGGGVYSSDQVYKIKVYVDDNLVEEKNIRARNQMEANEMAEDMEDTFKKKHGSDLRIKVIEAMANGGGVNRGTAWTLDHNQYNKGEKYEVPMSERKFEGGGYANMGEYFEKKKYRYEEGGNVDENTEMLMSKVKEIGHHVNEIQKLINNNTKVEAWVVAKAERSSTDLSDITHYIDGQKHKYEGSSYANGGSISTNDLSQLIGKYVNLYGLGVRTPLVAKIENATLSPEKYSKRFLILDTGDGTVEQIPLELVNEFMHNNEIVLRDSKGEPYAIELSTKYEAGGDVRMMDTVERMDDPHFADISYYAEGGEIEVWAKNTSDLIKQSVAVDSKKVKVEFYAPYDEKQHSNYPEKLKEALKKPKTETFDVIEDGYLITELVKNPKDVKSMTWVKEKMAEGGEVKDRIEEVKRDAKHISKYYKSKTYVLDYPINKDTNKPVTSLYERFTFAEQEDMDFIKSKGEDKYFKVISIYDNGEEQMVKGGGIPKSYTHFIVRKSDKKIINGYDYKGVDAGDIKEFTKADFKDMEISSKDFTLVSKQYLSKKGINPLEQSNWTDNYKDGGMISKGDLVKVKKYGWIMRVDDIKNGMYYLENDKRGTMNGNAGGYFIQDIEAYGNKMSMGGKTTFKDKEMAIAKSLLKRKKVSPKVQKDYGKTYSRKEALESAKRIAGAMRKKEMAKKKS